MNDSYNSHQFLDTKVNIQNTKAQVIKESLYATVMNSGHYGMPRKTMDNLTYKHDGVVGIDGVEKGGHYYNAVELRYTVQVNQWQQTYKRGCT